MSRQESLEILDARIRVLDAALADLKQQRNALIHVCRLPSEILIGVFKLIQHGCGSYDEYRMWETYESRWVELMVVCRRFRQVALETPTLWSTIDTHFCGQRWNDLCLRRSFTAPLCILDSDGSVALEYMHRARSITVTEDAANTDVLHMPAPHLQNFHFTTPTVDEDEGTISVDNTFLGGDITSLVQLTLGSVTVEQIPRPLASLRYFLLESVSVPGGLIALNRILEDAPVIEEVYLRRLDFHLSSDDLAELSQRNTPSVSTHLQRLCVADEADIVSACLRVLSLPNSALGLHVEDPVRLQVEHATLGHYHAHIFQTWLDHANRLNAVSELIEGTLKRNQYGLSSITYGGPDQEVGSFCKGSPSFCFFSCLLDTEHPALDHVTTLHLAKNESSKEFEMIYGQIDEDFQARFIPNVRDLIVEGYGSLYDQHTTSTRILMWIMTRGERLKSVRFIGCAEFMRDLSINLHDNFMLDVSWVDADGRDRSESPE